MKVRLTVHRPDMGKGPGDVVDLEPEQAVRLLSSGQAEAVPEIATAAVLPEPRKAVIPEPVNSRFKPKRS